MIDKWKTNIKNVSIHSLHIPTGTTVKGYMTGFIKIEKIKKENCPKRTAFNV